MAAVWTRGLGNLLTQAERRQRISAAASRELLSLLKNPSNANDPANQTTCWFDNQFPGGIHHLTVNDAVNIEVDIPGYSLANQDFRLV